MKIKRDKIYHFIAGWMIYILTSALSVQFGYSLIWTMIGGIIADFTFTIFWGIL